MIHALLFVTKYKIFRTFIVIHFAYIFFSSVTTIITTTTAQTSRILCWTLTLLQRMTDFGLRLGTTSRCTTISSTKWTTIANTTGNVIDANEWRKDRWTAHPPRRTVCVIERMRVGGWKTARQTETAVGSHGAIFTIIWENVEENGLKFKNLLKPSREKRVAGANLYNLQRRLNKRKLKHSFEKTLLRSLRKNWTEKRKWGKLRSIWHLLKFLSLKKERRESLWRLCFKWDLTKKVLAKHSRIPRGIFL